MLKVKLIIELWEWILIIKANNMHYFSTLFRYTILHVSDRLTVHLASEVEMD